MFSKKIIIYYLENKGKKIILVYLYINKKILINIKFYVNIYLRLVGVRIMLVSSLGYFAKNAHNVHTTLSDNKQIKNDMNKDLSDYVNMTSDHASNSVLNSDYNKSKHLNVIA